MSSSFGKNITFSVFGQSHSAGIGIVIDGLPAGESIDMQRVKEFMARRMPGGHVGDTARREPDIPHLLSGMVNNITCGAPLCAVIDNTDTRPADYDALRNTPRPSHADYPIMVKYGGYQDSRGGGHSSGRLTAPLCFAGAVCEQILERKGVRLYTRILEMGDVKAARLTGDSVGGIVECAAEGLPVGLGAPMFAGVESRMAAAIFGVPAVRGIEFGAGFAAARMKGSEHNDPYYIKDGAVQTETNHHGGVLGGFTTGMPLRFQVAIKPTSSLGMEQDSVDIAQMKPVKLTIGGRHDACIVPRAAPVVEAVAACVLLDLLVEYKQMI